MAEIDPALLQQGNRRTLGKAITLVESHLSQHRQQAEALLQQLPQPKEKTLRIGITGSPGVGKSTFIEALGLFLVEQGNKVAVLAVDPSSPVNGGSILGDKTRMERLARSENAFIRPAPSNGSQGGVTDKSREILMLCEAAGYNIILVETVGVGQSEYQVASMVDFFLVLVLPSGGDELQGIKKGIVELADALLITKADGDMGRQAKLTQSQYTAAMRIVGGHHESPPAVLTCSAMENEGIAESWDSIYQSLQKARESGRFDQRRAAQNQQWTKELVYQLIDHKIRSDAAISKRIEKLENQVAIGDETPLSAARQVLELLESRLTGGVEAS